MHAVEVLNVAKPQREEFISPAMALKELQCCTGVIVDAIDDHLHEVNAIGLDFIGSSEALHGDLDKLGEVLVSVAAEIEHDGFGELAAADAVHGTETLIGEDL